MTSALSPGTAAHRALAFIVEHPGATWGEIHEHVHPGAKSNGATSRAVDRLRSAGLIRKERDGQKVRHYPVER